MAEGIVESGRAAAKRQNIQKSVTVGPYGAMPMTPGAIVKSSDLEDIRLGTAPGTTFVTLMRPNISVTQVPQDAGLQYYMSFHTFINSEGWFLQNSFINLHANLVHAGEGGGTIYTIKLELECYCTTKNFYYFYQQTLPPQFFSQTDGAFLNWDSSSPWYACP